MFPWSSTTLAMKRTAWGAVLRSTLAPWVPCPSLSFFGSRLAGNPWWAPIDLRTFAGSKSTCVESIPVSKIATLIRRFFRFSSTSWWTWWSLTNHESAHSALQHIVSSDQLKPHLSSSTECNTVSEMPSPCCIIRSLCFDRVKLAAYFSQGVSTLFQVIFLSRVLVARFNSSDHGAGPYWLIDQSRWPPHLKPKSAPNYCNQWKIRSMSGVQFLFACDQIVVWGEIL